VLQTDENCGLVQQVVQSQTRTNIKKLTKTFVTLSLSDVASRWVLSGPLVCSHSQKNLIFFQNLLLVGIFVLSLLNADSSAAPSDPFVSEDGDIELGTIAFRVIFFQQSERQSLGYRLNPIALSKAHSTSDFRLDIIFNYAHQSLRGVLVIKFF
jgi:hypothetical protein